MYVAYVGVVVCSKYSIPIYSSLTPSLPLVHPFYLKASFLFLLFHLETDQIRPDQVFLLCVCVCCDDVGCFDVLFGGFHLFRRFA